MANEELTPAGIITEHANFADLERRIRKGDYLVANSDDLRVLLVKADIIEGGRLPPEVGAQVEAIYQHYNFPVSDPDAAPVASATSIEPEQQQTAETLTEIKRLIQ